MGPQMIPGPQMIRDHKWSGTTNDPGPQMIPDRKDGKDGVDRELAYVTTDVFIKAIL